MNHEQAEWLAFSIRAIPAAALVSWGYQQSNSAAMAVGVVVIALPWLIAGAHSARRAVGGDG